jgi:TPR repeat protein
MKHVLPAAPVFALVLALVLASAPTPSVAGALEDGVKAYSHADYAGAQRLLMPLAEKGNVDAQYSIGLMYANGQGVDPDKVKAHTWFDLASRKGDKDAAADRDALEGQMTPEQIAAAKQAAAAWKRAK